MRMTRFSASLAIAAPLLALSNHALSGSISAVKVDAATGVVGQQIKVTVDGLDEGICGLRVEYGNGDVDVTKMNESRDRFPRSFMKSYSQPGTYTIIAKGGRDGSTLGCPGESRTTVTIMEAPRPAVVPAQEPAPVRSAPAAVSAQPPVVFGGGSPVTPQKGTATTSRGGKAALGPQEPPARFGGGKRVE